MSTLCNIAIKLYTPSGLYFFIDHDVNFRRLQIEEIFVESESSDESIVRPPEIVNPPRIINNQRTNSQPSNDDNHSSALDNVEPSTQGVNAEQRNVQARVDNPDQERNMFGGFLDWSQTSIRSPLHATALIGVLQLAYGNENGVLSTLGYNNRTRWINKNINAFFSVGGPLGYFCPICADVFKHHLKKAENLACVIYNRTHSDGRGSEHEDVPEWARAFFPYFEALDNSETATQRALNIREECNRVAASLIGRQAPLGATGNKGPVMLWNETSPNRGHTTTRQPIIPIGK